MTPDPQSIRTFRASSLPEALAQVKRELGADALILGTRQIERRGIGALAGPLVEITAAKAVAGSDEATKRRSDEEAILSESLLRVPGDHFAVTDCEPSTFID